MRSPSPQAAGAATLSLSLGTAAAAGLHAPNWVWIATGIGAVVCLAVAVGLYFSPPHSHRHSPAAIKACHAITAGGDIEANGPIESGHALKAGGHIRSSTQSSLLQAAIATRNAQKAALGQVNPLFGHFRIEQFATPLQHDEEGCVFRIVIAADCPPTDGELRTDIKDTLEQALSRSSLEAWASNQVGGTQLRTPPTWLRSEPNSAQIVTFKRYWSSSTLPGFSLWAKATLQLPPGYQFGSRVVFVLDVVERGVETNDQCPRLSVSLRQLHEFLHTLATTAIDQVGTAIFPLVCEEPAPSLLGPNYQMNFGDRSLETFVHIPESFERSPDSRSLPWAEINTPEDRDPRDLGARDSVIRKELQKILRNNGYDRIEDEIAKLPVPA